MVTFGERLRNLRKSKKLTQQQLADVFYLNKSSISRYENNSQIPENEMLQKIADYFGISVDYLLGRDSKIDEKYSTASTIELNKKEKIDIEKEAKQMIDNLENAEIVEFCGNHADDEDKEFLKLAYEKFLSDVRVYNKMKYTPKKYK